MMERLPEVTHAALIKPIPSRINLVNVAEEVPSKACKYCALIVPDRSKLERGLIKTDYERVDLYPHFPELKASAKAGCELCRLLRKSIRKIWAARPMEEWGVGPVRERDRLWDEYLEAPWDRKVKIHKVKFGVEGMTGKAEEGVVINLGLEFGPATRYLSEDPDVEYGEIGQALSFKVFDYQDMHDGTEESRRQLPSASALSSRNLEMICKWIDDCKSSHPTCHLATSPWLPTRLLDVGTVDKMGLARIVETATENIRGPYAALSHMWGDPRKGHSPPVRTLKANYEEMRSGIPRDVMSRNFIDAVICTRQLGLKYIWIDSLCIIQDSSEDWKREAAMMDKVYKYAEVTIVATSAISANDGYLERQLATISAVKTGYTLDSVTNSTQGEMIICEEDTSDPDIDSTAWNKRGWTLQERSISTRMVHFCKNKFYFECRANLKSEENEPLESYKYRSFRMWPRRETGRLQRKLLRDASLEKQDGEDIYKIWNLTVTEYSQRLLTMETDRLVAINAIAEEMNASVQDTYLQYAGMWMQQLQKELLWQVTGSSRPTKYMNFLPSWSWASVNAAIQWEAGKVNETVLNKVLAESFQVMNEAKLAEYLQGQEPIYGLRVKTFVKPIAFMLECGHDDRWINGTRFSFPYDVFIPSTPFKKPQHHLPSTFTLAERNGAVDEGAFVVMAEARLDLNDTDDMTTSPRSLAYLHIDRARPSGLVLEKTVHDGCWRRVGVASVFGKGISGKLFQGDLFAEDETVEVTVV